MIESINFKDLDLSLEESRDMIEFLAKERNVSNYKHMTNEELLSTLKKTPQNPLKLGKRKNNKTLTTKPPRKVAKLEINQSLTLHRPMKIAKRRITKNLTPQKSLKLGKRKSTQNLTYERPSKLAKVENLAPQKPLKTTKQEKSKNNQQQILSKTKERIEIIREELKKLSHKLSKSELKEIKKRLYNIENKKELLESETTRKHLDELDEKILKLDKHYDDDDFEYRGIKNVQDLFKLSIDEDYTTLVKSGYNNNYIQYESKGDKILTIEEYLSLIEPYLTDMINDYKSKGEWKIQLTAEINFTSLKPDSDETRIMHTKSDNEEIMIGSDTSDVIKELFESFLQRYQESLQEKMRGSDFAFDGVNLLYYDFNKISLNRGGSYIESPKRIKDKKSTINPKNNDYKCFQYAVTVALNHNKIKNHPQRVSKIKPFIDQYNWSDIDFPSTSKDWKKFELNNESIALNILYVPHKTGKIHLAYKSKHNLTREKQVILLMITDGEKCHYTAVTRLSGLLRGLAGNNNGDFDCLNCFHAYRTENKLEKHKKICENYDYCYVEMPNEDNKIIKYNQGEKICKVSVYYLCLLREFT